MAIQLPQRVFDKVSLGNTTLHFFSEAEFLQGQVGYSVDPGGQSLAGDNDGDWKESWQVIGYEDLCGDPIFIDVSFAEVPVYTASHGMGEWKPTQISDSFEAFSKSLKIVAEIAVGRENAVKLVANPIGLAEAETSLDAIRAINPNSDMEFWELLFGIYR
jgi:hypothetical protein